MITTFDELLAGFSSSGNKMQFKTTVPTSNSGFDPNSTTILKFLLPLLKK